MGPAQTYVEQTPVPVLSDLVRVAWIQRIGAEPYAQRNLPTGGVELHFPFGSRPRLVGPLTGPSVEVLEPGTTVLGGPPAGLPGTGRLARARPGCLRAASGGRRASCD